MPLDLFPDLHPSLWIVIVLTLNALEILAIWAVCKFNKGALSWLKRHVKRERGLAEIAGQYDSEDRGPDKAS